jgi:hypothetical protein
VEKRILVQTGDVSNEKDLARVCRIIYEGAYRLSGPHVALSSTRYWSGLGKAVGLTDRMGRSGHAPYPSWSPFDIDPA